MITLTETAQKRIRGFLNHRGKGLGIRLGLKKTGCSGWAYVLEYADSILDTDEVLEFNQFKVLIDKKALPALDGMTVDYVKENMSEGFKFHNPQEKSQCGCGESFQF